MRRSWPGRTRPSERSCGSSFSENHRTSDASGPVSATPPTMSQTQNSLQQDEDTRWMSLPRSVPRRGKRAHLHPVTAFLLRFLDDVFGRSEVHVCPTTGHRPAVAIGNLPHHQQAAVSVEDRAAHVDLRRRVACSAANSVSIRWNASDVCAAMILDASARSVSQCSRSHPWGSKASPVRAIAWSSRVQVSQSGSALEALLLAGCRSVTRDTLAATGRAVVAGPLYPDREVLTFPSGRPRRARRVRGEA